MSVAAGYVVVIDLFKLGELAFDLIELWILRIKFISVWLVGKYEIIPLLVGIWRQESWV
jgi:hypothetical protein